MNHTACIIIFIANIFGIYGNDQYGAEIMKPKCYELPQTHCTDEVTHSWCKWNDEYSVCIDDHDGVTFVSVYDSSPLLLYFWIITLGLFCYFLREYISKTIIYKFVGKHLDKVRKDKCVIYCAEFILLIIVIILYSMNGSIAIIWNPNKFENLPPDEVALHVGSYNIAVMLTMIMYVIEMSVEGSKMRWNLKMHHIVTLIIGLLFALSYENRIDMVLIRMQVALSLYFALEPNVFLQLMIYRINPNGYLWFHYISTATYIITRILIIVAAIIVYVDWMNTDFVQNELFNNIGDNFWYFFYILVIPILNILLNISQWYSIQALLYISKQVTINNKIRKELLSDPAMMELHDIWLRYDETEDGFMEFKEFKLFVTKHLNGLIIQQHLLGTLWHALGFKEKTEDTKQSKMKWYQFKQIFKPSIKAHPDFTVTEVIEAKLKQLLEIAFKADHFLKHTIGSINENMTFESDEDAKDSEEKFEKEFRAILIQQTNAVIERKEDSGSVSMDVNNNSFSKTFCNSLSSIIFCKAKNAERIVHVNPSQNKESISIERQKVSIMDSDISSIHHNMSAEELMAFRDSIKKDRRTTTKFLKKVDEDNAEESANLAFALQRQKKFERIQKSNEEKKKRISGSFKRHRIIQR